MTAHDQLQSLVDDFGDEHHCPSVAWGLVVDGEIVAGDGLDTVYRIASMTKSFTCAAVLALRDEGTLVLDRPVADYAPELAGIVGPAGSPPITLRHLMSMQAGLATDDPWADRHLDISTDDIDVVYRDGVVFAMPTGTGYEYSNLGFGMIGRVVWRATGVRVQDHITRRFLQPLGMTDSTWTEPQHQRWARPFRVQDGVSVPDPHHPIGDGEIAPMGGLWTTVRDLARWISFLSAAHDVATMSAHDDLLSTASRREMQMAHTHIGRSTLAGRPGSAGYGFGLRTFDDDDLGMNFAHSGGVPGYGTNMRWLHGARWTQHVGAIALANTTYAPTAHLTMRLLADVSDTLTRRTIESPMLIERARQLVDLLQHWNDDAARALFADNVELDESFARRRAEAATLIGAEGSLDITTVVADTATRGTVHVSGDQAHFSISLQLAPLAHAPVQWYEVSERR